jgi:hypothetical protein
MKKTLFYTMIILSIFLALPISNATGISVGDNYDYEVQDVSGDFSYDDGSGTVSGETDLFRVGDTGLSEGSEFNVEVTDVGSSSVDFDIRDSDNSLLSSASSTGLGFSLSLLVYSLYPFVVMGISGGSVNPIDVSKGVSLGDMWYMAPPSINWESIFDTYNDTENWSSLYSGWEDNEGQLNSASSAKMYDGNDTISFTLTVVGDYVVTADSTDLTIIHSMRFDYDITDYNLLGYWMTSNFDGTYEGSETDFHMVAKVSEATYTRNLSIPIIFIGLLSLIGGISVIVLRKK